jgi:hypothetical protein
MRAGDLVRHKAMGEWGSGVVVDVALGKCVINFEHKAHVMLRLEDTARLLEPVASSEVPEGSFLLDKTRWAKVGRVAPAVKRPAAKVCAHCTKTLTSNRYSADKQLKSCPSCSKHDGKGHVFYPYPAAFTEGDKTATGGTLVGPPSHCTACRSSRPPMFKPVPCALVT